MTYKATICDVLYVYSRFKSNDFCEKSTAAPESYTKSGLTKHYCKPIAGYNNEVLKSIQCPTLLLFAEHDINGPPDQNIGQFNQLFGDNPPANFTIKGGQHGFYKVTDQCVDWDIATQQPFDPQFQYEVRR